MLRDEVVRATRQDLECVLGWLEREYREDGSGFWCNRGIIESAQKETRELWVIRRDGEAVAFQVGEFVPSIVSVRKEFRGRRFGTALFEASLERATAANLDAMEIECSPATSIGFWRRLSFREIGREDFRTEISARFVITRAFDLPSAATVVSVEVSFYREEALYERASRAEPLSTELLKGALLPDGYIQLERRVMGFSSDLEQGDLVVSVKVDGVERYFGKAKYQGAEQVGVERGWRGATFHVDRVLQPLTAGNGTL